MLETLRIQNFALIDGIEVDFSPGLNALTGETGAGKSILIGALNLVLGARASGEVVRAGADRAQIEAVFRLDAPSKPLLHLLDNHGVQLEENRLLMSRVISADGRSRGYVGGVMAPISVLAEIGDELVDLHGQHEHQSLLKTDRQLGLLDGYAGLDACVDALAGRVSELRGIGREIEALSQDDRDRVRRLEFLRFEIGEIDAARLTPGEEEEAKTRVNLINNAEKVFLQATQVYGALYESETMAAVDGLGVAERALEELAGIDASFRTLCDQLSDARNAVEAVAAEVRGYTERIEFDPHEQEELNRRLALIGGLKRKYGNNIAEILNHRDEAAAEMEALENRDTRIEELRARQDALNAEAEEAARALSKKRRAAAKKLDKQVAVVLNELGMKDARFETQFEGISLSPRGCDRVEFLLAANPGEPLRPLRQVASGGEISRIMLALKTVFAGADQIPALVFDEIDAGVGGGVARHVGAKLRALAASHQVLCITHLAQIAVKASAHYTVVKENENGRVLTRVRRVERQARIEELARLLDGSLSKASINHARTLLAEEEAG